MAWMRKETVAFDNRRCKTKFISQQSCKKKTLFCCKNCRAFKFIRSWSALHMHSIDLQNKMSLCMFAYISFALEFNSFNWQGRWTHRASVQVLQLLMANFGKLRVYTALESIYLYRISEYWYAPINPTL